MTLNKKQRKFANEYIKNKGNAYKAAIKAGYSLAYAKNAGKKIVEFNNASNTKLAGSNGVSLMKSMRCYRTFIASALVS